jgi:DNA segregation ATPase FtsK/SpoIIIE, S-DNA-T family
MLERRGASFWGWRFSGGAGLALMLGSYSPDDPGWMVATEEPGAELLGRFGAAIASTLMIMAARGPGAFR